jgi:molybdate transport system ATP-binding protein
MSVKVDIRKRLDTFELQVAFEAGQETLGFLGASGCGKSLTLRCIAGLETPDEGHIEVGGRVFYDSASHVNLRARERKCALLFQNYMLFPNLTVAQNIAAGLPRHTAKAQVHDIVKAQLARFDLEGFGHRYPSQLSGGQQQRIALARMLTADPAILMLDEPFSALDAYLKDQLEQDMLDLFADFAGSVIYVSHDIDESFRFCDRIAVYDNGHITQVDAPDQLISHPATLSALQVTGVKNISPLKRLGARRVLATAWNLELECSAPVPEDARYLGFRASYLQGDGVGAPNTFDLHVHRASDSRFERDVILDTSGPGRLYWKVDKLQVPPASLPTTGDTVRFHIPPDKIYLV